jgi:hypothetical protein
MTGKAFVFSFIAFTFSSNKQKSRVSVDEPGIESQWGEIVLTRSDGPGVHPASGTVGTVSLSAGWSGRGVAVTTHPLVPRLKKE